VALLGNNVCSDSTVRKKGINACAPGRDEKATLRRRKKVPWREEDRNLTQKRHVPGRKGREGCRRRRKRTELHTLPDRPGGAGRGIASNDVLPQEGTGQEDCASAENLRRKIDYLVGENKRADLPGY